MEPDEDRPGGPMRTESPLRPLRRPDLLDLQPFAASTPPAGAIRMNANEVALGPLPGAVEAARRAAQVAHRYPDNHASTLLEALSARTGLEPGQITVGPGSINVCLQAAQAVCGPGDEIVYPWPSFEAYPLLSRIVGATPVPVALDAEARPDLAGIEAAITQRTRMIFLCSPNNPTGPALEDGAVRDLIGRLARDIVVVLDEAYVEFVRRSSALNGLQVLHDLIGAQDNVLVLRTFSKAYGLAGLRIGYGCGATELIDSLRCVALPYAVNTVAQQMAIASLQATEELERRCVAVIEERGRMQSELGALGYRTPSSDANFLWLDLPDSAVAFAEHCAGHHILVRALDDHGVRVTLGIPDENDALLAAARDFGPRR